MNLFRCSLINIADPLPLTLKRLGGGGQFDPPSVFPSGFSKNVSSKERVFFVTFNIIISHIFPENFIEIPQVVQKI